MACLIFSSGLSAGAPFDAWINAKGGTRGVKTVSDGLHFGGVRAVDQIEGGQRLRDRCRARLGGVSVVRRSSGVGEGGGFLGIIRCRAELGDEMEGGGRAHVVYEALGLYGDRGLQQRAGKEWAVDGLRRAAGFLRAWRPADLGADQRGRQTNA